MYAAEHHAESLMIMDWRHFPEYEIGEIWKESNIEPLYVLLSDRYSFGANRALSADVFNPS